MRQNADTPVIRVVHRAIHEARIVGLDEAGQTQTAIKALLKAMPAIGPEDARAAVERVSRQ